MEVPPFTHLEPLAVLAEPEDLSGSEVDELAPAVRDGTPVGRGSLPNGDVHVQPEPAGGQQEQLRFGWGRCTPSWLQPLVSQRTFLLVFVLTCVLQGMYYTYVVSVITTIEKLFQFQSKTTGIVFSATEIGQIGGALLLTYYGGQGHRPRWIACGIVLFAVCVFTCSLPHFMFSEQLSRLDMLDVSPDGSVNGSRSAAAMCQPLEIAGGDSISEQVLFPADLNSTDWPGVTQRPGTECAEAEVKQSESQARVQPVVLAIFFISLMGVGIGQTMAFNLGIPYMDDNVSSKESPMYFAFIIGMRIFGPVFGFVLGSLCTSIYVYPLEQPNITTKDPRWVGAWWLGMFIISGLLAFNAVLMFGFPRRLPSRLKNAPAALTAHHPSPSTNGKHKNPSLREFPRAVKHLLQNDILMFRTASNVLHVLPIAGLYTFLPKYLETQFRLTANAANIMAGLGGILVMFLGILGSGLYIRRYQPSARFITGWIALSALLYSAGMAVLMFVGCHQDDIVGMQKGYGASLYNSTCSAHCVCPSGDFSPVCGSNGYTYLSPCLAGCSSATYNTADRQQLYEDCSCMEEGGSASIGYCPLNCDNFYWFIPVFCVFVLIHSTSEVGAILVTLRCVDPHEKALALGFIAVAIGLFGNVPCPVIYGAVVDSACVLWQDNCGQQGACLLYDTRRFRHFFFGVTCGVMFAAFLVDCVVWYKADRIKAAEMDGLEHRRVSNCSPSPEALPLKQDQ